MNGGEAAARRHEALPQPVPSPATAPAAHAHSLGSPQSPRLGADGGGARGWQTPCLPPLQGPEAKVGEGVRVQVGARSGPAQA